MEKIEIFQILYSLNAASAFMECKISGLSSKFLSVCEQMQ